VCLRCNTTSVPHLFIAGESVVFVDKGLTVGFVEQYRDNAQGSLPGIRAAVNKICHVLL